MIYLLVPCYNEAKRIRLDDFVEPTGTQITFVFCDDGSTDETCRLIKEKIDRSRDGKIYLFRSEENVGKAEVVRLGYHFLVQQIQLGESDWVGFWDADLATPLTEIPKMLIYLRDLYGDQQDSVWASRVYRLGSEIIRSPFRHYLGRAFATVISLLLKVQSYDSQCGAKLFRREAAKKAFAHPFISRWIFDVEIMLRVGQDNIVEFPLMYWRDIPGSKVKVFRELLRVGRDILKIRRTYCS